MIISNIYTENVVDNINNKLVSSKYGHKKQ